MIRKKLTIENGNTFKILFSISVLKNKSSLNTLFHIKHGIFWSKPWLRIYCSYEKETKTFYILKFQYLIKVHAI